MEFFNIRSVAKYQKKLKGGSFGDIKKLSKKPKKGESHIAEKVRTFCFGIFVKLAHTHGLEHEHSGLKGKHLTTTLDHERLNYATCGLKLDLSRGKKAPALSYNTCLSQV